jgi:hypothetical protein
MFDPYQCLLALPTRHRPPTHYELLGISPDESNPWAIEEAALRRTQFVRTFQTGPFVPECTHLLNEIARAAEILLNPAKRKAYDRNLTTRDQQPMNRLAGYWAAGAGARSTASACQLSPTTAVTNGAPAAALALIYVGLLFLAGIVGFFWNR